MRVHCDEGVATYVAPDPCAVLREDDCEASVGERIGQPLSRESVRNSGADVVHSTEGTTGGCVIASGRRTRRGLRLACTEVACVKFSNLVMVVWVVSVENLPCQSRP